MNKIFILGNVGQNPEVKTIGTDTKVAKMTVAVTEKFKNQKGEKVENTTWFNVTLWRGLATIVEQHVSKGQKVLVEGKMTFRQYEDKDGVKRTAAELQAENLQILTWKKDGSAGTSTSPVEQPGLDPNDDLPF